MEKSTRPILKFILLPLIILSAFFQSILQGILLEIEKSKSEKLYYGFTIVQIIYLLSISFSSGIVISFVVNEILNLLFKNTNGGIESLVWIPFLISVLSVWIILLNHKNVDFNLPKLVLSTCSLFTKVNFKTRLLESIISVPIIASISCMLLVEELSNYDINNKDNYWIIVLIFCFFISFVIYSESTKDELMRLIRQCILWLLLFIGFTFLTLYQIIEYVNQQKILENKVSAVVSILGLALTMPTIIDKIRKFYEIAYERYEDDINKFIYIETNKYSIFRTYDKLEKILEKLKVYYNTIKFLWITFQRDKLVKIALICLFPLIFIYISNGLENKIKELLSYLLSNVWQYYIEIFNNNEELSIKVGYLIVIGLILLWCSICLVRNFKKVQLYGKMIYITRIILFLLIFIMILSTILNSTLLKSSFSLAIGIISLLFVVLSIILRIIEKHLKIDKT